MHNDTHARARARRETLLCGCLADSRSAERLQADTELQYLTLGVWIALESSEHSGASFCCSDDAAAVMLPEAPASSGRQRVSLPACLMTADNIPIESPQYP